MRPVRAKAPSRASRATPDVAPGERSPRGGGAGGLFGSRGGKWLFAAGLAALGVVGLCRWNGPARAQDGPPAAPVAHAAKAPEGPRRHVESPAPSGGAESGGEAPLPRSLEGTEVDGRLEVDAAGHLVPGPRVIALFDYYFAATGEESEAAIRERIRAYSRKHLTEPALGETLALLDRYVAYRGAAGGLRADDTKGPAERLAALRGLRRTHFGDAADKLFGAEEREAEAAIARAAVAGEKGLSAAERSDRLAEVDERLPAAERQARAAVTSVIQLREDEAALRAAGADEAEVQRFRAGTLGEEAAARLEDLDRQRAAWKQRVEAFRRERDQRCGEGAAGSACEAGLLQASFDEHEQIRVRAILGTSTN